MIVMSLVQIVQRDQIEDLIAASAVTPLPIWKGDQWAGSIDRIILNGVHYTQETPHVLLINNVTFSYLQWLLQRDPHLKYSTNIPVFIWKHTRESSGVYVIREGELLGAEWNV